MSSAATGSLGALLMIAPLAAIPVFAIVGMPRFSSMVAAPGEQELYEVEPEIEAETPAQAKLGAGRGRELPTRGEDRVAEAAGSWREGRGQSRRFADSRDTRRPKTPAATNDENAAGIERFEPGLVWPQPQSTAERPAVAGDLFDDPDAPEVDRPAGGQLETERWMQVARRIRELGIRQHQLSPDTDSAGRLRFVFTCLVAQAGEPAHRFSASGSTAFEAIDAALDRVSRAIDRSWAE